MGRLRPHLAGGLLLAAAGALWLSRGAVAWALASLAPTLGYPMAVLLVKGGAALLTLAAVWQERALLASLGAAVFGRVDALEQRLEKLPKLTGRAVRALAVGGLVGGAVVAVAETTQIDSYLETRAIDLFFRLRFPDRSQVELATGRELPSANRQEDVVVLALDDQTISHLGWPIARVHYARLIDAVSAVKPASLSFDVSLVDPSREHAEWDLAIGEAAKRAGNTSFSFTIARSNGEPRATPTPTALASLDANSIPWHESAAGLPEYNELVAGDAAPLTVIDPVAENARAIAMANVLLDGGDDVLRHSLVVARLGHRLLPSLSLRIAANVLGVPLSDIRVYPGSHVDVGGKRRVPIDELGRTLVRYQGRHDTQGTGPFRYLSIWSLIRSDSTVTLTGNPLGEDQRFLLDEQTRVTRDGVEVKLAELDAALVQPGAAIAGKARFSPEPGRILELAVSTTPAAPAEPDFEMLDEQTLRFATTLATTKTNRAEPSAVAGKHVLVGSTALAAADVRISPLGEMPGVEHHATMLANLLHDDFFRQAPDWAYGVAVLLAALAAAAISVGTTAGGGLLLNGLLLLAMLTASYLLSSKGVYVPIVGPSVGVGGSYFLCLLMNARAERNAKARAEADREFVRHTFGRYLTEQVVQELLDSPDGLKLGGQRDFVTIMMTDLRGFTSMCGTMEPENVVKLLNHYLEAMTRIITKYGGTIDEFIGDAILVVFGAPIPLENEELRATACAIEMLNAMPEINRWNAEHRLPKVEMGIGIHSGEVVLGNIGSELRAKYGIVGSTINLTSRVESYTVGGQVFISEATRALGGEAIMVGTTQVVSPKGVKGTLTIHEALAVGVPYDVKLQSATEHLVPPRTPLVVKYASIKNKQVAELTHVGHVEALSELGMELRVDEDLPALSDLLLKLIDGDALRPGDIYGKVIKAAVRPNVVYLRLTSVPPEAKPVLEDARGGPVPPAAQVPESALVPT